MAQIAIKGHDTRGKEVIEILEMLGGKNTSQYFGDDDDAAYSIEGHEIVIYELEAIKNDDFIVFTLEEFLEKYPYKVGDKVKPLVKGYYSFFVIQDMAWYCVSKEVKYRIYECCWLGAENLKPYKEENMEERMYADLRLDVDKDGKLATEATIDGDKITAPENYLIGKVTKVDNGVLVEFVKKQPRYPKTYKECCDVLGLSTAQGYKAYLIIRFQELLIARDAYWKISGEQMGLGKPWEPNWLNTEQDKFVLYTHDDVICLNRFVLGHNVLAFPTAEMRDFFFENFKDLIEECKEFL